MPKPKPNECEQAYLDCCNAIHRAILKVKCGNCARRALLNELVEVIVLNGGDKAEAYAYLTESVQMLLHNVSELLQDDEEVDGLADDAPRGATLLEKPKIETAH
jgi:hypothetical protein